MQYFEKKIAYLKGLCDGSGFTEDSPQGKIFHGMLEMLDDMSAMLESVMEDEDFDEMCDDGEPIYFHSFICPTCGEEIEVDGATMEEKTEITCPACGNSIPMGSADMDEITF